MSSDPWLAADEALAELFVKPDAGLAEALVSSAEAGLPEIAVSPNLGKLLFLLVQISGAKRVLEIGTLGGYSTIWLARGLPPHGSLVSLELEERHAKVARRNLARTGLADIVSIEVGPATQSLAELIAAGAGPFDLIFIDADKENYPAYLEGALALSRPGSVIVADNVVREGAVFDAAQTNPVLEGIRTFLADVASNPRLSAVGLQLVGSKGYDGIAIVRVVDQAMESPGGGF